MNYRHAFHAGNFADVMKHAVLALIVEYLRKKDKPFRVIDTHAGAGLYDLTADAAARGGEWQAGIGRLREAAAAARLGPATDLLAPYLAAVDACNPAAGPVTGFVDEPGDGGPGDRPGGGLTCYPGSPLVARHLMRPDDRMVVNELHPEDGLLLDRHFARDRQVKVLHQDAWAVLKATLPPKERRGVVLIDPPFEVPGEFDRLCDGLIAASRRFASGIYMIWYPLKNRADVSAFHERIAATGLPRLLVAALAIRAPGAGRHRTAALYGSGLLIHNPPYGLDAALETLLPVLAGILGEDESAKGELTWLRGEA